MSAEQQVRTLIRAWPRPDRLERGEEIVGTTLDLLPDGATHVPVLLALNLVIGGLKARWRIRPPLWRWAYYRMGGRLPTRWHRWMLNDLTSPGWRRRVVTGRAVGILLGALLGVCALILRHPTGTSISWTSISWTLIVPIVSGGVLGTLTRSRKDRDRQLVKNGYYWTPSNDPPWPPPPVPSYQQDPGGSGPHQI